MADLLSLGRAGVVSVGGRDTHPVALLTIESPKHLRLSYPLQNSLHLTGNLIRQFVGPLPDVEPDPLAVPAGCQPECRIVQLVAYFQVPFGLNLFFFKFLKSGLTGSSSMARVWVPSRSSLV